MRLLPALLLAAASSALAQEPQRLARADVETLVTGKKVEYLRASDGATIGWDFRSGGEVFYTTSKTQRNIGVSGNYTLEDDGAVCFKWRADKYFTVPDGCVLFRTEGGKTQITGRRDPERVIGTVVQ